LAVRGHVVIDQNRASTVLSVRLDFLIAILPEVDIANGQNLVHKKQFAIRSGGHSEAEVNLHARGVTLERGIDEFADLGEFYDLIPLLQFPFFQTKHGSIERAVLPFP
jgi:hypothetical protein